MDREYLKGLITKVEMHLVTGEPSLTKGILDGLMWVRDKGQDDRLTAGVLAGALEELASLEQRDRLDRVEGIRVARLTDLEQKRSRYLDGFYRGISVALDKMQENVLFPKG